MEAPRGVQVSAAAGDFKATCRKELHLQSTEGEIFLNADKIRLGNLPTGSFSSSSPSSSSSRQTVYELCVCPNGKLYLSPAGVGSTCQSSSNICLWS
ncbi:PREDICTED: zeta-sarcoglycan [Odobenus rosmarus divergens]|uniref:Zeta-sarcoglycan n=3 Tax=Pinnipedia TaxID=3072905 RepID=A0A2U3WUQ2_ODORO|nr:PREDICTED: zeta-sarcoglycan [Odobenus rosmarus divergens]